MYLKETSDLRAMAAMGGPQHFFRPPMFLPGGLPHGMPAGIPMGLTGNTVPGGIPGGVNFDPIAAAVAVASVRSAGHPGVSPVSPIGDTTVLSHSNSPNLPTGTGTLHHPTPKV